MLTKIAYKIRHSFLLKNADGLWNLLRKPYHFLIDINHKGIPITVNEHLTIRIPPQYFKMGLSSYEETSTGLLIDWIRENPNAYILDIGCSTGYLSAVCLFSSGQCTVIGFDSDLPSLKASQLMCKYASGNRLQVLYGLITDHSTQVKSLSEAVDSTYNILQRLNLSGDPDTTQYVNLDKNVDRSIPEYAIDDLYREISIQQPVLVKCDIEGAEFFALDGAKAFIRKYRPVILLSVHPDILPIFNCTVQQVMSLLLANGYTINLISVDHEEHWWCNPKPAHIS